MKFPPPDNWQDFEKLTRALCADEWSDPQAQILGRQGQAQHGVDVVGWDYRNRRRLRVGVQCKRRSIADAEGNVSVIGVVTMCDVVDSLAMTESLSIPLDSFVLATTAQQDARLQEQLASLSLARKPARKTTCPDVRRARWSDTPSRSQASMTSSMPAMARNGRSAIRSRPRHPRADPLNRSSSLRVSISIQSTRPAALTCSARRASSGSRPPPLSQPTWLPLQNSTMSPAPA